MNSATTDGAVARVAKWRIISQTAEYALRAVLYIADRPDELTSAADVAAAVQLPEKYLARVLNTLAHAGVLNSTRGPHGGFGMALPAAELTLARIVAPFDAVGDAPRCLLRDQPCGRGKICIAHNEWHGVATSVRGFFSRTTVADLLAGREVEHAGMNDYPDTRIGD